MISEICYEEHKKLYYCRGTARHSVEFLQLQNSSLENQSPGPIVWHYLCDPTFSHFDTIQTHTHTYKHTQTDGQTHDVGIYCA